MSPLVYLCDLTHTGQGYGSEMVPLPIGLIKSYADDHLDEARQADIRLFKDPARLDAAFAADGPPLVAAFSNYLWNAQLSSRFAQRIKERHPETLIVFGGPNYPLDEGARGEWYQERPWVDCYLQGEGERPFFEYVRYAVNPWSRDQAFVHIKPSSLEFLDEVPSPYLSGSLDDFLADRRLVPMIETTRGCPFTCTFCVDGAAHPKIRRYSLARVLEEVRYIAARTHSRSIYILDLNFGMYWQDLEFAEGLAKIQEETEYPKFILAGGTGKEHKGRVIEVARKLRGLVQVTASLQSTNPETLQKIKRTGIAPEALAEMALEVADDRHHTAAEFIMGLPGETKESFLRGILGAVDLGFNKIRMHQLVLLSGSEMDTPAQREEHHLQTATRVLQRSFGRYQFLGSETDIAETEEVVVGHAAFSLDDYLYCRAFALTVALFYNEQVFEEIGGFLAHLGRKHSDFLIFLHDYIGAGRGGQGTIVREYSRFVCDAQAEFGNAAGMPALLQGQAGNNLLFNAQGRVFYHLFPDLNRTAFDGLRAFVNDPAWSDYLAELETYVHFKKGWLRDLDRVDDVLFEYFNFAAAERADGFRHLMNPMGRTVLRFKYDQEQVDFWDRQKELFGTDDQGLGKMIARAPMKYGYRKATEV